MSSRPGAARDAAARAIDIVEQVQLFGLASAAAVAERYIGAVDRYLAQRGETGAGPPGADTTAPEGITRLEEVVLRSLGVWATGLAGSGTERAAATAPREAIELAAVPGGACSRASAWVHNPTAVPAPVTVRLSPLTSADGHVLPCRAVAVLPVGTAAAWPVEVAPGGSCESRVEVHVPVRTPPGHFHAVLTSTATPRQALPVHLEVLAGEGTV